MNFIEFETSGYTGTRTVFVNPAAITHIIPAHGATEIYINDVYFTIAQEAEDILRQLQCNSIT